MDGQRKDVVRQNYDALKKQIEDKEKMKLLEKQLGNIDRTQAGVMASQNQMMEQVLQDDKKKRQQMYRDLLDTQMQYNRELQGYGNMTDVEKKLNRQDLLAYKNYDNNQYSMIPGVSPQKKIMEDYVPKTKMNDLGEQHKRLQNFGYNRE